MVNTMRRFLFWSFDYVKGNKVNAHYKEIKYILENLNTLKSKEIQERNLERLLQHAIKTTPYYREEVDSLKISDFPIINKNQIVEQYDKFKSEEYLNQKNFSAYTSGSTGTPFKVYHNLNKKHRNLADVIYFSKLSGFQLGDKLFYLRHWDQYNSKTRFQAWKQNIYMHPVSKLEEHDVKMFLNEIHKTKSGKGILAYASSLNEIRDYILKYNLQPQKNSGVNSVIGMAEALNGKTKTVLQEYFGVNVVSRYSNVENGIIAQQVGENSDFHINWASYYVEILKLDRDEPVSEGELGRIVVTDLFNYAMPMIRYDTGDIGLLGYENKDSKQYPVLKKIEGRKLDMIFDSEGKHISSYAVYHILKYPNIKQYQFIQEDEIHYTFKLNVNPEFNSETQIRQEFQEILGSRAIINILYVDEIPLLSSGKRKFVINKCSNSTKVLQES